MNTKQLKDISRMALLLCRRMVGAATPQEMEETERWADVREHRRQCVELLSDPSFVKEELAQRARVDGSEAERRMAERIAAYAMLEGARRRRLRMLGWGSVAASVLLLVGVGVWYARYTQVTLPTVSAEVRLAMEQAQQAAEPGAVVAKADEGVRVITPQEMAQFRVDDEFAEALASGRKVTTYADKEYWTTLEDGTIVHLNYASRLIFPERFGRGQRDVILVGEAYFMVAKDRSRPFIVHTPYGDVKQYGTEFHVSTKRHGSTEVVLVHGSVGVTGVGQPEVMMLPGQRAVIGRAPTQVEAVDTIPYVAWHTGKYFFSDVTLGEVADVIARWYGYEVQFGDAALREERLTGNFGKEEPIEDVLEALEMVTGLSCTLQGGKVVIEE